MTRTVNYTDSESDAGVRTGGHSESRGPSDMPVPGPAKARPAEATRDYECYFTGTSRLRLPVSCSLPESDLSGSEHDSSESES